MNTFQRNSFFLFCLLLGMNAAFAQTQQGAMFIQKSTMSLMPSRGVNAISFQDAVTPQIRFGYFYRTNVAIGGNVQITPPFDVSTLLKLGTNFEGFTRYYVETPVRQLKPYVQGNIGYSQGKNATSGIYETRMGFSGQIGASYFTNKLAGIDVSINGIGLDGVATASSTKLQAIYPKWSNLKVSVGLMVYTGGKNPPKPGPNNNNNRKPVVPQKPVKKSSGGSNPPKKNILNPSNKSNSNSSSKSNGSFNKK